jgi:protein BCP1
MPKRNRQKDEPSPEENEEEQEPSLSSNTTSDDEDDNSDVPSGAGTSEEASDDDEDGEAFDSIEVDFEFSDPTEDDFQPLRTLLTGLLDGKTFAVSDLVNAVIQQSKQNNIGSLVKCGASGGGGPGPSSPLAQPQAGAAAATDVIGLMTVLPLGLPTSWSTDIYKFCSLSAPDDSTKTSFNKAWNSPTTALLLTERVINCPPQLAGPLLQQALEEVGQSTGLKSSIKSYIYLGRAFKEQKQGGELVHVTPDGEAIAEHADLVFDFACEGRLSVDKMQPRRVVAVISSSSVMKALKSVQAIEFASTLL